MKKFTKSTNGVAAVEFALLVPFLFVLIFGIIEFGAVMYNQSVITNASREGARYAATYYTNPANGEAERPTCSDIKEYVGDYVHARLLNFTDAGSFGTSNVKCPYESGKPYKDTEQDNGEDVGYVYKIGIEYEYDYLVLGGLIKLISGGSLSSSLTLTAETVMRDENQLDENQT